MPKSKSAKKVQLSKHSKKLLYLFFALVVVGLLELFLIAWKLGHPKNDNDTKHSSNSSASAPKANVAFNKNLFSPDESKSLWVVVNKGRVLSSDYVPPVLVVPQTSLRTSATDSEMKLRIDTAKAMEAMFSAAKSSNAPLRLASGYRSYAEQVSVYGAEVNNFGQAQADRESARPGHSEHQTGLAADLEPLDRSCEIEDCFAQTSAGKWLAANSYKYGFIIRYQQDNESLTGYKYEPWHVRYIGNDLAAEIHKTNQTLEQFFGLPVYTDYPSQPYQLKN